MSIIHSRGCSIKAVLGYAGGSKALGLIQAFTALWLLVLYAEQLLQAHAAREHDREHRLLMRRVEEVRPSEDRPPKLPQEEQSRQRVEPDAEDEERDGKEREDELRDRRAEAAVAAEEEEKPLDFDEVMALVRHGKVSRLKDALAPIAKKKFDPAIVKVPYVEDFGTAYVDAYERETFNLNKVNEHGNTMLHVAAQNGNVKIAKLLVEKGANPNHQNKGGQTAGHFANAYQFYDFLSWLFDPNGGGADDTLENMYGLGPYDGLSVELENG